MTTMAATKPHTKSWELPKDFLGRALMFVITILLSAITIICTMVVKKVDNIDEKVDLVQKDVQDIKVANAKYFEKVDAIEKKGDKK